MLRIALALSIASLTLAPLGVATAQADPSVLGGRIFDADAFWYRPLPDDTPVAPDSRAIVADLVRQGEQHNGAPGHPAVTINTAEYSPPIYVADADDPLVRVGFDNCQNKPANDLYVGEMFTGKEAPMRSVRVPVDAEPAGGTDAEVVIYDAEADRVVELWKMRRAYDGSVSACWGGVIEDASESTGVFEMPFGVAASGLSLLGGTITAQELAAGEINHVVGIAVPYAEEAPTFSAPANRTDGRNPEGWAVPAQGQMLRLPADLDLDSLRLSPVSRMLAQAAQDYGLIVWDTAGMISVRAQGPASVEDRYFYRTLFRGNKAYEELGGGEDQDPFPLDRLEVLPVDYVSPLPGAPAGGKAESADRSELAPSEPKGAPQIPPVVRLGGVLMLLAAGVAAWVLRPIEPVE